MPFTIEYIRGDLFQDTQSQALAHCVSADLAMGAGIALEFRRRFGQIVKLKNQEKTKCQVARIDISNNRKAYYLVTKKHYWDKPKPNDFYQTLVALKGHMLQDNVRSLAIPRIGSGLDQLKWPAVEAMLCEVFANSNVHIRVYSLNQTE